jgi:hypothetical protein
MNVNQNKSNNHNKIGEETMINKIVKKYFGSIEAFSAFMIFPMLACTACIFPELAIALPTGPDTLKGVAKQVQDEVQMSGLGIAMNATGLAAVGFSVFNGFNKAFLISGGLILLFTNIFFPYVNTHFGIK